MPEGTVEAFESQNVEPAQVEQNGQVRIPDIGTPNNAEKTEKPSVSPELQEARAKHHEALYPSSMNLQIYKNIC